jgi:beta-lactamase class A
MEERNAREHPPVDPKPLKPAPRLSDPLDDIPEHERTVTDDLRSIERILVGGNLGVAARDAATGEEVTYNADWTFPTASTIKAMIVAELYAQVVEGRVSPDEVVTVEAEDFVGGSGILAHLRPGMRLSLAELALLAIKVSDNTASNLVLRRVGGPEAVNRRMHEEWGMPGTRIHRPIKFDLSPGDPPHTATGTPRDLLTFMDALARGDLHSPAVCDTVQALLETPDDTAMLPRYLEYNPFADDLGVLRPMFTVLHKPGAVNGVRNDAGIIRRGTPPYGYLSIAVCTKGVDDPRWTVANAGCEAVSRVAKLLTNRFLM